MWAVIVRLKLVTICTVLHGIVSVSPSIIASVVTQWLEALWHKSSEETVCSKIRVAPFTYPHVFQPNSGPHIIFRPTYLLSALGKRYELAVCALSLLTPFIAKFQG